MSDQKHPVLDAIRLLLKAEGAATRSSIRAINPDLSHRHIVQTIADNRHLIKFGKQARIVGLVKFTFSDFKKAGLKVYFPFVQDSYGCKLFDSVDFDGLPLIAEKHKTHAWGGGLGDSYKVTGPLDSPELRADLAAAGYVEWEPKMGALERFWIENQK